MDNYGTPPVALVSGDGAVVTDADGRSYVDLLGGIAVNVLGHRHPAVIEAVTRQLNTLGHTSNLYATEPGIALAEALVAHLGARHARAGVLRQLGHRGQRGGLQDHPAHRAHQTRCRRRRLPRPHHGLARADRPAVQAGPVRTAARRSHPRPVRRRRRAGRRGHRRDGRGVPRADHGGGRRRHPASRLPGRRSRVDRPARCTARARRGADRHRTHRHVLRPPARRHHARLGHAGKGIGRRAADRRLPGHRRRRRAADARPARQHVRRQSRCAPRRRSPC